MDTESHLDFFHMCVGGLQSKVALDIWIWLLAKYDIGRGCESMA